MANKPKGRLEEIKQGIENGKIPQKPRKISKKMEFKGFIIYFLISIILLMTIAFGIFYYGGTSFFDGDVTHRSCDFLSIEGFPILVRCSDGTYWDASRHNDGDSGNIEQVMPAVMMVEPEPIVEPIVSSPFLCQMEDILKL